MAPIPPMSRRSFLVVSGAAVLPAMNAAARPPAGRSMTINLACGSIGVRANQLEAMDLAHRHGFESVTPDAGYLGSLSKEELRRLLDDMKAKGLVFGAGGLPVDFRRDAERFKKSMANLPKVAAALERADVHRIGTWITPTHGDLTYRANFQRHAVRLREAARVLEGHGIRLGLEYVGPKTSWSAKRFPFIHTLVETKELIAEIGLDNVGVVVDSWHWYTAGETKEDLLSLRKEDIVAADLNDAPAGRSRDEQMDLQRELPMATGVIDVGTFLNALNEIGFDGPVRAEPFNAALRKLPREEAVAVTARAMKRAFALIR